MARFCSVPSELKIAKTWSCSTSCRVCWTVLRRVVRVVEVRVGDLPAEHAALRVDVLEVRVGAARDRRVGGRRPGQRRGAAEQDRRRRDARVGALRRRARERGRRAERRASRRAPTARATSVPAHRAAYSLARGQSLGRLERDDGSRARVGLRHAADEPGDARRQQEHQRDQDDPVDDRRRARRLGDLLRPDRQELDQDAARDQADAASRALRRRRRRAGRSRA